MPASTIILPGNFGAWSGPGYAGGLIIPSSADPSGSLFREIYGDTTNGKANFGVRPTAFLDAAPREHDLGYEYAERLYGKASSEASVAAQHLTQFAADMDLLTNVLSYQPAQYDFISTKGKRGQGRINLLP